MSLALFDYVSKRVFTFLWVFCLFTFHSYSQTPIPGHAGSISDGTVGAMLNQPVSVFVSGGYAYVASTGSNALEILDISNPNAPIHQGSINLGGTNSVYVSGSHAFVTCGGANMLAIVDVSDPSAPALVGSIADGDGGAILSNPVSVFVSGQYAYVASKNGNALEIVDVSNFSTPLHAGSLADGVGGAKLISPASVYVSGTTAFVASYGSDAIEIIDASDASLPIHISTISNGDNGALLSNPTSVFVSGNFAYVTSFGNDALEILNITDLSAPLHEGSLNDGAGGAMLSQPLAVFVSGNFAYVTSSGSNALEIIDVSNSAIPIHSANVMDGSGGALLANPQSVYVSGNNGYVVGLNNSLEILSLFIPTIPTASSASLIGQNQFQANWNILTTASGYFVDASLDNFTTYVPGYNGAVALGNSLTISGLNPGTTYQYRVRATNTNGTSGNSSTISALTLPAAPIAGAATNINQTGFDANWSTVSGSVNYFIDVSADVNFSSFVGGYNNQSVVSTSLAVSGLSPGVVYYYRIRSSNATGSSPSSNVITQITTPTIPGAGTATSITQNSFVANWNSSVGADNYYIDVATDASFSSLVTGYTNLSVLSNSVTVSGLSAGTTYYYQVRAANNGGISGSSSSSMVLTIPATPVATSATSINQGGFTAHWNAVVGAASYEMDVASDVNFLSLIAGYNPLTTALNSVSVSGLSPGTIYYYRARSVNVSGTSPSSNAISLITIPSIPAATAASGVGETSFTANWTTATGASGYFLDISTDSNFGSTITGYSNLPVATTSQSVTGLAGGSIYYYRVRSTNAGGTSLNSSTISVLTIPPIPSTTAATLITQSSFTANWTTATGASGYFLDVSTDSNFGSTITGYSNLPVATTSQSVTGLTGGTTYYYRVRSANSSGASGYSLITTVLLFPAAPTATAASSITQIGLVANWTNMMGATSYLLDVSTDAAFASYIIGFNGLSVASNSSSVTSLSPGVTYYYRVRSVNASGTSPYSNTISQITIPATPVALAATAVSQTGFTANWNVVTGASNYFIDVASDAAFASLLPSYSNLSIGSNAASISGLSSGTVYYYRVKSSNSIGSSLTSNVISQITIPSNPVVAAATVIDQTSFTANWAPTAGATGYFLDVALNASFTSILSSYTNLSVSSNSSPVTGLSGGTTYYYRVRASNSAGPSGNSGTTTVLTLPAAPVASGASSITQNSFTANWSSSFGAVSYSIDLATDNSFASTVINDLNVGNVTSYNFSLLTPSTTYYYRVRALDATGSSANSNTISTTTTAPLQAFNLNFSSVSTNSITLNFTPGNGSARLVTVNAGTALVSKPVNGVTYSASTNFGNGSAIGTGYVVSKGAATSVTVNNLLPGTLYYFQVYEYSGSSGSEIYNSTVAGNNPNSQVTLSTQPSVQAGNILFSSVDNFSMTLTLTAGNGSSRLVVARAGSAVNATPVNGTSYVVNNSFGNGSQIGVGNFVVGVGPGPVNVSGLTPGVIYHFEVFEFNGSGGSENYNLIAGINRGSQTTLALAPTIQSNSVTLTSTVNSVTLDFNPGNGASHLVVANANTALNTLPLNGTSYNSNTQFGIGDVIGSGFVVGNGVGPITVTGLAPGTNYYFQVFDFNGSGGSEKYLNVVSSNNPSSITTLATLPLTQPGIITFSQQTGTSVRVSFVAASSAPAGYLVLRATTGAPDTAPVSGIAYNVGTTIGNATVAYLGASNIVDDSNLPTNTTYFYSIYSYNGTGASINYLTTSPASGNVTLDIISPVISFPIPNPTTIASESVQILSVNAIDNFAVQSVQLFHRGITESTFVADPVPLNGGANYSLQTKTNWYDPIGMEYYFVATDENGNASAKPAITFYVKMIQSSISFQLPSNKGNGVLDYQIFSFPYQLNPSSAAAVFPDVASKDISKFRMLWYNPVKKDYDEFAKDEISSVEMGKGYWLLTNTPQSVTLNNISAPAFQRNNLDSIKLQPGWNQIGNPYPVPVKWSDVQNFTSQPPGTDTLSLYVYKSGWVKLKSTETLAPFTGGFVKNTTSSAITITIPFQGQTSKGGREYVHEPGSDISKEEWQVDLNLFQGEAGNKIGGIGMAPHAYYGFDRYDDSNPPRFGSLPELIFHQKEVNVKELARSVVPTQSKYTWSFSVSAEAGRETELIWNEDLGQGEEQLLLLDEQSLRVIDMRTQTRYSFVMIEGQSFKIFFGKQLNLSTNEIKITSPFPNPTLERKSNFTVGLPDSNNLYEIALQIFNSAGETIYSDNKKLAGGIQIIQWQAKETIPPGIYFYRIAVSEGNKNSSSTGKIIIP